MNSLAVKMKVKKQKKQRKQKKGGRTISKKIYCFHFYYVLTSNINGTENTIAIFIGLNTESVYEYPITYSE